QRRRVREAGAPWAACPGFEGLGRLLDGPAPPAKRSAHVAACTRCQTELALLRAFEAAAPRPEEQLPVRWISARLERRLTGAGPAPRSTFRFVQAAGFAL